MGSLVTYHVVPANDPRDLYAAGYDGNHFSSRDEAAAALLTVAEAFGTDPAEWVIVRATVAEVA